MKRKFINFLSVPLVLIALLTVTSCDNDDEPKTQQEKSSSIEGEWFYNLNSSKLKGYSIEEYKNDGTVNTTFLYCYPKAGQNLYQKNSGSYTLTDSYLNIALPGMPDTESQILYLDEYTMVQNVYSNGAQETAYKIVATLNVKVNESVKLNFDDVNFKGAVFYESCDEHIVKVDVDGTICGVKRGTAYVVARSGAGAVVARVIVTDPVRPIDEFDSYLRLSKRELLDKLESNYTSDYGTIVYYPGDGEIEGINFRFTGDMLSAVLITYWDEATIKNATSFLERKFKRYGVEENGFNSFTGENDKSEFFVTTDLGTLTMMYTLNMNDFEKYDSSINLTADLFAAQFNYQLTDEDNDKGAHTFLIDGNLYYKVLMMYDDYSRKISTLSFTCQDDVTVEQMEEYLKNTYDSYLEGLGYYNLADANTNRVFVKASTNKYGVTQVKYFKF